MISDSRQRQALRALNAVLVRARLMAIHKAPHENIAYVLDCAELLPMLMLEETDRTIDFRDVLKDIESRFPEFAWALEQFDAS